MRLQGAVRLQVCGRFTASSKSLHKNRVHDEDTRKAGLEKHTVCLTVHV